MSALEFLMAYGRFRDEADHCSDCEHRDTCEIADQTNFCEDCKDFDSWLSTENEEGWYIKNILNWKTTVDTGSVYCAVLMEREQKR